MKYSLSIATSPASEPVTTSGLKAHMRVTHSNDDTYIAALIKAARQHVETITRRALITQTWDLYTDRFPSDQIEVPLPDLQSVTWIKYTDVDGVTQTLATSVYTVDIKRKPARIVEAYDQSWPSTREVPNAVNVRFVAGYGLASNVPEAIKQATMMYAAHLYENREATTNGTMSVTPMAVDSLLAPYRIHTF